MTQQLIALWADLDMLRLGVIALALAALLFILLWRIRRNEALRLAASLSSSERRAEQFEALHTQSTRRVEQLEPALEAERQASHAHALRAGQLETRAESQTARINELSERSDELSDALYAARESVSTLSRQLAEARLAAEKDRERAEADLATMRALREEMSTQFKAMSAETLRVQGADMQKTHAAQIDALLTPFREQVGHFQRELSERNRILDAESARLRDQIQSIGAEAKALTTALKGDTQRQGAWGEMILERILEESGLIEGTHYMRQQSWTDENGQRWRPDVVVRMPRQKVLVIDSKVSLTAYEEAVNCEDMALRKAALDRHVLSIRNHIKALSDKGYDRIDDASVDYVLMFIPIEGAFSEALRVDPGLTSFALDRKIGLATPTTLMVSLRTVDHIWTVERRETNALEIAKRAGALYDKVAGFVDALEAVGGALDKARGEYDTAMDRLTRGNGNVIRQVEMLRELGARTQKRIGLDHDSGDLPELPPADSQE